MHYLIYVTEADERERLYAGPVAPHDGRFLRDHIVPILKPLSADEYMHGPAIILHTLARWSYVLHETHLYWCSEWDPGLIVVRFAPDGAMSWAAVRSPNPGFGGREPLPHDEADYDEDAENNTYNLVFRAWDSQFDASWREYRKFEPASAEMAAQFKQALKTADDLGDQLEARYASSFKEWAERCKSNLAEWAGEGARLPSIAK